MTPVNPLTNAIVLAHDAAARLAMRPTFRTGYILEIETGSRRALVAIDGGTEQWVPLIDDSYVPLVGHRVIVSMNGDEPVGISPPKGPEESLIANPSGLTRGDQLNLNVGAETAVTPWIAGAGTTLAQSNTVAFEGTFSFRVTRTSTTGNPTMTLAVADCPRAEPGKSYNVVCRARAGSTARSTRVDIEFLDSAGATIQTFSSPTVNDSSANWNAEPWMTAMAPVGTVQLRPTINGATGANAVAGEFHYFDRVEIEEAVPGAAISGAKTWLFDANTESWSNVTWVSKGQLMGNGCVLSNAGSTPWQSPGGTSGETTVAGRLHSATVFVEPIENNGTERTGSLGIDFWNGATYLSSVVGATTTLTNGTWTQLTVPQATAPASTTRASLGISVSSPGGAQRWRIDSAVLTLPPIQRIRRNTNATYVETDETTSIEMRATAGGLAVMQFPHGLINDPTTIITVVPGDHVRTSMRFINESTNATFHNVASVATWYDANGGFLGIQLGATPITSNPGAGWHESTDTFEVPAGVYGMRLRLVWLPATGEAMFVSKVVVQRASLSDAKVLPRGPVYGLTQAYFLPSEFLIGNGSFISSEAITVMKNPGVPVNVHAFSTASVTSGPGGSGGIYMYTSISLDGGQTWSDGISQYTETLTDISAFLGCEHQLTNLPVGDIVVSFSGTADLNNSYVGNPHIKTTVMPA